jgi:hypothetical protein
VLLHRFSDATRPLDYFIFIKASVTVDAETALVFFGYSRFAFPRESPCLSLEKYSFPTTPKEIIFLGHVDFFPSTAKSPGHHLEAGKEAGENLAARRAGKLTSLYEGERQKSTELTDARWGLRSWPR